MELMLTAKKLESIVAKHIQKQSCQVEVACSLSLNQINLLLVKDFRQTGKFTFQDRLLRQRQRQQLLKVRTAIINLN